MRDQKFRQAAFVYLHVAILYEATAYVMLKSGTLPNRFGPPVLWLIVGGAVGGFIFYALLRWKNAWFARGVWALNALRTPALINGAFFAGDAARMPPSFYIMALVIVIINLGMLARAGWDL